MLRSVNLKNPLKISAYGGCDTGKPIGELAVLLFLFFFFVFHVCFLFEFFFTFCLFIQLIRLIGEDFLNRRTVHQNNVTYIFIHLFIAVLLLLNLRE
jgi:hypothetical protein